MGGQGEVRHWVTTVTDILGPQESCRWSLVIRSALLRDGGRPNDLIKGVRLVRKRALVGESSRIYASNYRNGYR